MGTSNLLTLVALINAMIGGTILVLPILFLSAGIIPSIIVTVISGAINYWSCSICYSHLGKDPDLPESIEHHMNSQYFSKLYDFMVCLCLQLTLFLYFSLVVKQWEAILLQKSLTIVLVNGVVVFFLVVAMGRCKLAVNILGYGVLSIACYLVFVGWLWASAPAGNRHYPIATWNFAELCDTLATAFSLQGIFIPILKKNAQQESNRFVLLLCYIIGGTAYAFIGFAGSLGILNRTSIDKSPQTVMDYFHTREWPVVVIACIYLFHLYSVIPEYLLLSKKRLWSLIGRQDTEQVGRWDLAYIAASMLLYVGINFFGMTLKTMLAVNGSIFGFLFIYVLPSVVHLKCIEKGKLIGYAQLEGPAEQHPEQQDICVAHRDQPKMLIHSVLLGFMWVIGVFVLSYSIAELARKAGLL